jgi:alginate O-acetyltransferase complex protein AlgI
LAASNAVLFNSYEFLFAFLPVVWIGFEVLRRQGSGTLAKWWLTLSSLGFYTYWNPKFLPILLASMTISYAIARRLALTADAGGRLRKWLLVGGIFFNLSLLAYFKYTNFLVDNLRSALGIDLIVDRVVLPIGISFYTFQKIALLVDSYRGQVRHLDLSSYCLFVTFFPQLIAGPIAHHSEMIPQFKGARVGPRLDRLTVGLTLLAIGLFKKVFIADTAALAVDPVFVHAGASAGPGLVESWIGVLSYAFQIYFDFSAYSDMAVGLGWMFGIRLPINFASPYKATSVAEFWQRWHITLSRFLRNYLYIPIGGNRHGQLRHLWNLFLTMTLGGVWHGAGWTFLVWGSLHGSFLVVHRIWQKSGPRTPLVDSIWLGRVLTFLLVVIAWVPFRAPDLASMRAVYAGMLGLHGLGLRATPLTHPLLNATLIAVLLAVVWCLPNTYEWMGASSPGLPSSGYPSTSIGASPTEAPIWTAWRPAPLLGVAIGGLLFACVVKMNDVSPFLYFQF